MRAASNKRVQRRPRAALAVSYELTPRPPLQVFPIRFIGLRTDLKADLAYLCRQYLMTVRKDLALTLAIQLLVSRPGGGAV